MFISRMMSGMARLTPRVSRSVKARASMADVVTDRRTPSISSAPKRWPVMTEKPDDKPMVRPKTAMKTGATAPTAARALTPMVRPTMMMSAIL